MAKVHLKTVAIVMAPQTNARKKPHVRPLPDMAMNRGTSATHANHPMSYLGKVRTSKNPDRAGAMSRRDIFNILVFNTLGTPPKVFVP
jgi:hypothetical protein